MKVPLRPQGGMSSLLNLISLREESWVEVWPLCCVARAYRTPGPWDLCNEGVNTWGSFPTEAPIFKASRDFLSLLSSVHVYFHPQGPWEKLSSGFGRVWEPREKQAQWRPLRMSGAGGRDPSSSQPASAMLVHRGQASGCPERGVLSKNVGHHLVGVAEAKGHSRSLKGWPLGPCPLWMGQECTP